MDAINPVIEIYGHSIDTAALPEASRLAMIRRGLTHFLGNETASKVSGFKERVAKEKEAAFRAANTIPADATLGTDIDSAAFAATDEEVLAHRQTLIAEGIAKLAAGTVGHAVRAPAIDPVEKEMERLAKADIKATLEANGLKVPRGEEKVTFSEGNSKSMDEMLATRLERFGDDLRKRAEKVLADKKRLAAKVKVEGDKTAEALGL